MKPRIGIALILVVGLCRAADVQQLVKLYEAILSSEDDSRIPKLEELASQDIEDVIELASADEIKLLLPLAKQCVHSRRQKIRFAGLHLFFGISLRPDGTSLLEPYVDDLGPLVSDADQPTRHLTIHMLVSTTPGPSAKVLPYLAARMNDKNTSPEEVATTAAGLLGASHPADPATLHQVLELVRERDQIDLTTAILKDLSLLQITHEEALRFVSLSLTDANAFVRRAAVEAARMMPKEVRATFRPGLLRVAQNPDENPETRSRALQVARE